MDYIVNHPEFKAILNTETVQPEKLSDELKNEPLHSKKILLGMVIIGIELIFFVLAMAYIYYGTVEHLLEGLRSLQLWILLAGLVYGPSLYWLWYLRVEHKQIDIAVARADIAIREDELEVQRTNQYANRYDKAIDKLGSSSVVTRVGAIQLLKNLSRDSEADHIAVMEVLTTYVRDMAAWKEEQQQTLDSYLKQIRFVNAQSIMKPRTDIQTALTSIGHRRSEKQRQYELVRLYRIDLSGSDLRGANLESFHLEGANLEGTHLEEANLQGAYLNRAKLIEARLDEAHLATACLDDAQLQYAYMEGVNLYGASLKKADLEGVHLERAELHGAHMVEANLSDVHLDEANLEAAHLEGAKLTGVFLAETILEGVHLDGARYNSQSVVGMDPTIFPEGFDPKQHGMVDVSEDDE